MSLRWIQDDPPRWDADKARIVGNAAPGIFDRRFKDCPIGELVPGDWWRVEDDGRCVGFGWMDVVWGEAEILLATAPEARGRGVGSFIVDQLEQEARQRGLNYVYNAIRPTHPEREALAGWLGKRGFAGSEDGSLFRAATRDAGN